MKIYSFEKLECWQQARNLTGWVYKVTAGFPSEEKYGLVSQMGRAALSIASNLAEGSARISTKDQSHFNNISYSSTIELMNQLIISNDLGFLSAELLLEGKEKIEKQTLLISYLRKSQQSKLLNS